MLASQTWASFHHISLASFRFALASHFSERGEGGKAREDVARFPSATTDALLEHVCVRGICAIACCAETGKCWPPTLQ